MGVQIPFSFPKSLDFKPLQTKVRILLWQMNRTQIGVIIYLLSPRMPCLAGFLGYFVKCSENADYGKSEQDLVSYYWLLVVKSKGGTTKN